LEAIHEKTRKYFYRNNGNLIHLPAAMGAIAGRFQSSILSISGGGIVGGLNSSSAIRIQQVNQNWAAWMPSPGLPMEER
jgi:hypothetical protein